MVLTHYYHYRHHECLQRQKPQSWTDSIAHWLQLHSSNDYACMYNYFKTAPDKTGEPWSRHVLIWSLQSSSKPLEQNRARRGTDRLKQAQTVHSRNRCKGFASVRTHRRQRGLAETERAVTLLTFNTHTFLTQHISVQSQWSFGPCCSKTQARQQLNTLQWMQERPVLPMCANNKELRSKKTTALSENVDISASGTGSKKSLAKNSCCPSVTSHFMPTQFHACSIFQL